MTYTESKMKRQKPSLHSMIEKQTQQTGIAGEVESASTEHNAQVAHRWDDLDYVRGMIATGGNYNALELLKALECALEKTDKAERHYIQVLIDHWLMKSKRRRALLWLAAERRRRREAERNGFV